MRGMVGRANQSTDIALVAQCYPCIWPFTLCALQLLQTNLGVDNTVPFQAEAREVETEHARLEAEGPASHRKKDLLDKATKEVRAAAHPAI